MNTLQNYDINRNTYKVPVLYNRLG